MGSAEDLQQRVRALEERLRAAIRVKQYSTRRKETHVGWYRRFVRYHMLTHPFEVGSEEVSAFLTCLAAKSAR